MKGQWLGLYSGDDDGEVTINIDEVQDGFEGVAYLRPKNKESPISIAYFDVPREFDGQTTKAFINLIDPKSHKEVSWNDVKHHYDDAEHSTHADAIFALKNEKLHVSVKTDINIKLVAELTKSITSGKSKIDGIKMSWIEFKHHLSSLSRSSYLFRGQQQPWSLCTSFHRRNRFRISKFVQDDVPQLHKRLTAITSHYFNLPEPEQFGAFVNLLQHHGYPTPLLDWSHSPYVAAFFAFRSHPISYDGDEVVRIYVFDNNKWRNTYPQIVVIDSPFPHLSVLEFISIDNPRLVPQQSVTTVSNMHDIEAYIIRMQEAAGVTFLEAIDIPAREREEAMSDLRFMGITAGAMFPGIDGVCEEVRERNFER